MKFLFVSASPVFFAVHYRKFLDVCARLGETHAALPADGLRDFPGMAERGVTFHPVRLSRGGGIAPLMLEVASLRRVLSAVRPDVVIPVTLKAALAAALANRAGHGGTLMALLTGLGYLFTGSGWVRKAGRFAVSTALARALDGMPHLLVFSNADDMADGIGHGFATAANSRVIPLPGVDVKRFAPSPEPADGFRVVLPARMLRDKGVGEFAEAAARLESRLPDASFLLAGGVDRVNPSRIPAGTLRKWAMSKNVEWLGHVDDMPALLASSHVVALPSYREGFPSALAEAMACGRAIVATDVPGCRAVAGGGERGLLVPPRNAAALSDAIEWLYRRPEARAAMGANGRAYAERYLDEEVIRAAFVEALRDACRKVFLK